MAGLGERNRRIVRFIREGDLTLQQIGDRYGVTSERIRQIGLMHGVTCKKHRRLDLAKVDKALGFIDRGMPIAHAAAVVGLNTRGLNGHLVRRGLHTPEQDDEPWTDREVAFLKTRYKTPGWSASSIGDKLGRTRHEVIGKANRLGLCSGAASLESSIQTRKRRAKVLKLRAKGIPARRIAAVVGATLHTVRSDIWRTRHATA